MKPVLNAMVVAAAALLCASCQTMTPEQRRAADEARCVNYGFRKGNDAFAECLQRIELDRRAEARANSIRMSQHMAWRPPIVVERRVIVDRK
ncbi:hypothetical protein NOF55_15675 [Rhizobiaceae bacterium BDR2-2]|uniref:Lipoprotein n=1 Tax=Ectorhizobium quercum TaxID=2965071 RepID=A0AAE3N247_9HYPH|nr:hypothetical protein [Ectorhizobium quercum]MCX8998551.1 hypothetical protein [Ectorhizobium quercum]